MKHIKLHLLLKIITLVFTIVLLFLWVFISGNAFSQPPVYTWDGGCKGSKRVNTTYIPNKVICYQTGILKKMETSQLLISPNPFQSSFDISYNLQYNDDLHCKIIIKDITGKFVFITDYISLTGVNKYRVYVKHLPAGMYILAITNSKGHIYYLSKLIKTE